MCRRRSRRRVLCVLLLLKWYQSVASASDRRTNNIEGICPTTAADALSFDPLLLLAPFLLILVRLLGENSNGSRWHMKPFLSCCCSCCMILKTVGYINVWKDDDYNSLLFFFGFPILSDGQSLSCWCIKAMIMLSCLLLFSCLSLSLSVVLSFTLSFCVCALLSCRVPTDGPTAAMLRDRWLFANTTTHSPIPSPHSIAYPRTAHCSRTWAARCNALMF
jgi:hypothetical protein